MLTKKTTLLLENVLSHNSIKVVLTTRHILLLFFVSFCRLCVMSSKTYVQTSGDVVSGEDAQKMALSQSVDTLKSLSKLRPEQIVELLHEDPEITQRTLKLDGPKLYLCDNPQ
jgi:hypothetical protein